MSDLIKHIQDHVSVGAHHVSKSLGIQSMPDGYALMLDSDQQYFYWLRFDGVNSQICWDKWAVRRGANKDFEKQNLTV